MTSVRYQFILHVFVSEKTALHYYFFLSRNKYLQHLFVTLKVTQHAVVVIWDEIFKTEKTIEIQLVRPTEVHGKV